MLILDDDDKPSEDAACASSALPLYWQTMPAGLNVLLCEVPKGSGEHIQVLKTLTKDGAGVLQCGAVCCSVLQCLARESTFKC